ncbi:hypothetical protein [Moraxella lacunata]
MILLYNHVILLFLNLCQFFNGCFGVLYEIFDPTPIIYTHAKPARCSC